MSLNNDYKEKIDRLRSLVITDEDIKEISGREKRIRALVLQTSLMKNDAAIAIVEDAKKRINSIDIILASDKKMTELDRQLNFREKEVLSFFLNRFDPKYAENELKAANEKLDADILRYSE